MNQLTLTQIEKERKNGKIIMILNILKSEIAGINCMGFSTIDDELISEWSQVNPEQVKKLREICFVFNLDNIIYDLATEKREESLSKEAAEELLLSNVSERIEEVLETYSYPFDIIKHVVPFALREDTKEISESNIREYSLVKKYSEKLYLMHKAMYEFYTEKP